MIDFSYIGQDAFVIQYEDLISLIGVNAVKLLNSMEDKEEITQNQKVSKPKSKISFDFSKQSLREEIETSRENRKVYIDGRSI